MTTDISHSRAHDSFNKLHDVIEKRTDIRTDEFFPYRLQCVKKIVLDSLGCLESVLGGGPYQFTDKSIRKIVEAAGYYSPNNASRRDVETWISGFQEIIGHMNQLSRDPESFYKSEGAERLLEFCRGMKEEVYPIKFNPFSS
jgi:hypothetical protein